MYVLAYYNPETKQTTRYACHRTKPLSRILETVQHMIGGDKDFHWRMWRGDSHAGWFAGSPQAWTVINTVEGPGQIIIT